MAHPLLTAQWHDESNTLVFLAAADETALGWLSIDADEQGLLHTPFYEPDLDGALTAIAFEPAAAPLLSHLPLALSERKEVRT